MSNYLRLNNTLSPLLAVRFSNFVSSPFAQSSAVTKHLVPTDRALCTHDWTSRYRPNSALVLHGKAALILGAGAINQQVVARCQGI